MAATFEDILNQDGVLMYRNKGDSMMPLLREGRDLMIISKKTSKRLSVMDIPLFKRRNGQYVLHRVMWVRKHDYVLCGDNQWYLERGISDDQILGVLTAVVRGGKRYEMSSFLMRTYSFLEWLLYPWRAAFIYARMAVWPSVKRKIFRR